MEKRLTGKAALVTGASSGIGEATALALADQGARIALVARRADRLRDLEGRIRAGGGEAIVLSADVAEESQIREAVDAAHAAFGRLDVLVNNAGVMLLGPVVGADTEDWRRMVGLNLLGLMYATHAALPHMIAQRSGTVVNISSVAGRVANPGAAVYAATKFGVGAFSEGLRREVYSKGVRVVVIEPGMVDTELRDHITVPAAKEAVEQRAQAMRQLQGADIAAAVVYAVTQPDHVNVNEILVRPTDQER